MRLKLLFILSAIVTITNAQDNNPKNPNVELPDFVITGKSQLNIKKVDKIKPDFVSSISEDFLKPSFSPEELQVGNFSHPLKSDMSFLNDVYFYNGNIAAGIGIYTIPTVSANYAHPFTNGIVEGTASGNFIRAYEDNSDRYNTRFGFNLTYWSDIDGEVLPGTQFRINADYGTTSFKFYSSANPEERRSLNYGKFVLDVKNDFGKNFLFGLNVTNKVANISQEEFKENILRLKGEGIIKLDVVNVGVVMDYRNYNINNLLADASGKNFFLIRPTVGLYFTKLIKGSFGLTFSKAADQTFNSIYASVAINLNKNFTLFGEFAPSPEFISPGTSAVINNYLKVDSLGSVYWKKKNAFHAFARYEFSKYFQIDGGIKYFNSDTYPYFIQSNDSGKFAIGSADMKSISPYANFLFYLGPYGEFYSTVTLNDISDADGNKIPYTSSLEIDADYSYRFSNGIKSTIRLGYQSKRYADRLNEISIGDYFDLGASFLYSFKPNLDFTLDINNILNQKNYIWNGYKDVPINVIIGVNYRL